MKTTIDIEGCGIGGERGGGLGKSIRDEFQENHESNSHKI